MSEVALAIVAVLAVGEFLLFGAITETFRDVAQLRRETGMIDQLQPIDLGKARGGLPSAYGLDAALDQVSKALVLFVDTRCGTCQLIVRSLMGDSL